MATSPRTAADLMIRDVVTVAPGDRLQEAMQLMVDAHVGSLPVMDRRDRCVGIISARDIMNCELEQAESAEGRVFEDVGVYLDPDTQTWENVAV